MAATKSKTNSAQYRSDYTNAYLSAMASYVPTADIRDAEPETDDERDERDEDYAEDQSRFAQAAAEMATAHFQEKFEGGSPSRRRRSRGKRSDEEE